MPNNFARCALYARVSTEEQARHGISLDAQLSALRDYAAQHGYSIVGEYVDDGISARKTYKKRPALLRLLSEVQNDRVDTILFIKLDRWFRNVAAYYQVQPILDAHNVAWRAILERYETETAQGRFLVNLFLSVGEQEADLASERVRFSFEEKRRRGETVNASVPFGFYIENKTIAVDREKIPIVQNLFARYAATASRSDLQAYAMQKYGLRFYPTTLTRMLSCEYYIGKLHGKPHHEQIIDDATWKQVQRNLNRRAPRTQKQKYTYLFSGYFFCADCGGKMRATTRDGVAYYHCINHNSFHTCGNWKMMREDAVEQHLMNTIVGDLQAMPVKIKEVAPVDTSKLRGKLAKLRDLYMNDIIDKDEMEIEAAKIRAQISDAESDRVAIDAGEVKTALATYDSLSKLGKRAFWSRLVRRLTANVEGTVKTICV